MANIIRRVLPAVINSEVAWLCLVLVVFSAVNLSTVVRCPVPTQADVCYADPGVNLYFGEGFTSTTNFVQDYKSFVAWSPLYPLLVYFWLCLFGFGCLVVRSLGYLLAAAAATMLWGFVKRQAFLTKPVWRIIMVVMVLGGFGVAHTYRMGHSTTVGMFLGAAVVLASTIHRPRWRMLAIAGIAALMPLTHPVVPVYAALLSMIVLLYDRTRWPEVIAGAIGVVFGALFLFALYTYYGAWQRFVYTGILSNIVWFSNVKTVIHTGPPESLRDRLGGVIADPSFHICFLLTLMLAARQAWFGQLRWRSPLVFGIIVAIWIPAGMFLLGHYPGYYSWHAYIPLVVCLCVALEEIWPQMQGWFSRVVAVGCLGLAAAGLPLYSAISLVDWQARDPAIVEALVDRNVRAEDWVFCDDSAYYATRRRTHMTFCGVYVLTDEEKQRITVYIGRPCPVEQLAQKYGGQWRDTGDAVGSVLGSGRQLAALQPYCLRVYRRLQPASAKE